MGRSTRKCRFQFPTFPSVDLPAPAVHLHSTGAVPDVACLGRDLAAVELERNGFAFAVGLRNLVVATAIVVLAGLTWTSTAESLFFLTCCYRHCRTDTSVLSE